MLARPVNSQQLCLWFVYCSSKYTVEIEPQIYSGLLTLCAIIHTPCFNCPIWRWCRYDHTLLLSLLLLLLTHTQTQHTNLSLERINMIACAVEYKKDLQFPPHSNKFTPTHTVHVLYTVHVTPILHTDMYKSLNAALKAAISCLRTHAKKSLELVLAEGSPPRTACHSSPKSSEFPYSD